jgi:hypothetical protein
MEAYCMPYYRFDQLAPYPAFSSEAGTDAEVLDLLQESSIRY